MRTVYLGTSSFAATVLRRLGDSAHRPQLVIAPPDRPKGRGRRTLPPPVAEAARGLGIELLQAERAGEASVLARIREAGPRAAVVCAFGQMIREPLLSELPILNVHPSLLPRWRGAAPIERAIMAGDERTGVSIMRLTEGLDSGPVALREGVEIGPEDDFGALSERLAGLGGDLLVRALDLQAEDRLELALRVRALTPHVGAYLQLDEDSRLGVRRARPLEAALPVGELEERDGALLLGCGEGALALEIVQPAGGKPMAAEAYLRGHPL